MRFILTVHVLLCSMLNAFSQALEIKITFEKDSISFLEPWIFSINLINTGDSTESICVYSNDINVTTRFDKGDVSMQLKISDTSGWVDLKMFDCRRLDDENGANFITLSPGETLKFHKIIAPPPIIALPDDSRCCYLRVNCNPFYCAQNTKNLNNRAISTLYKMPIRKLSSTDVLVFNDIKHLENPYFFLGPITKLGLDTSRIMIAELILEKYPAASVLPYLNLFLSNSYFAKARQCKANLNREQCLQNLKRAWNYGLNAFESRNEIVAGNAEILMQFEYNLLIDVFAPENPPPGLEDEFRLPMPKN